METTRVRVESEKVVDHFYTSELLGEAVTVKARGMFRISESDMPVSVHFQVNPGHELLVALGDHLKITIERE